MSEKPPQNSPHNLSDMTSLEYQSDPGDSYYETVTLTMERKEGDVGAQLFTHCNGNIHWKVHVKSGNSYAVPNSSEPCTCLDKSNRQSVYDIFK